MHGLIAQQQAYLPLNSDESYFLSLLSSPTFYIPSPVEVVAEQQEQQHADPQHGNGLLTAVSQQQHQQLVLVDKFLTPSASVSPLPQFLQSPQEESKLSSIVTKSPRTKKKAPLPYASNLLNLCFNTSSSSLQTSSKRKKKQATTQRKHRYATSKSNSINDSSNKGNSNNKHNTTSSNINNQQQYQHPKYQCDFDGCNKVFTRPYNLKSHKRTHTAERPFVCPHCPKRFARQHDRNRHAKLHTGIKAYTCPHCNKAFARQDALSRHQRPSGHGLCCNNSSNNNSNNSSSPFLMTNVNRFATTTILSSSL